MDYVVKRMVDACQILSSPSFSNLQSTVFEEVSRVAGDQPESILFIENNDHRREEVADAWATDHRPLRLDVTDFNTVVSECYEEIAGPSKLLDALTRRQIIDRALRDVARDGLLDDAQLYRDQFTDLFTEFEAEGYNFPSNVRDLVEQSALPDAVTQLLAISYERFHDYRGEAMNECVHSLSEAYSTVLESDTPVSELIPHTDVVVVSGHYELSTHEAHFLDWIAEELPVYVILPLVETEEVSGGSNQIATSAIESYRAVGCTQMALETEAPSRLVDAAGRMYTDTEPPDAPDLFRDVLQWYSAPTPDREIRHVATRIRKQLSDGVDPNDVLVVIPGLISYQEHAADVFEAAGVESVGFANKLLYQTHAGRAMLDLVELCVSEPRTDIIARLAANPVVTLGETRGTTDRPAIANLARRLPPQNIERLLEELDSPSSDVLEDLFDIAQIAGEANSASVVAAVRDVFGAVDLQDNLEIIDRNAETFDARMEMRSYDRVDRVLDAIDIVADTFGFDDPIGEIQDALERVRVPPASRTSRNVVEIVGPRDAFMQSFSHLYFVGLTEANFPVEQDRPRFFDNIIEALPEISITDDRLEARYQFATLLSNAESVYITTPETSFDDEDLLESSILDELARVTGLEPTDHDPGIGLSEDVQRALRHHRDSEERELAVAHATESGAFDYQQAERLLAGASCASNRADPEISEHDGQLDSAIVDEIHPPAVRSPYSPTQLKDYAQCGFKYFMQRVLRIEAPDEFHLEPQRVDLGRFVHRVLEDFFRGFQGAPGEPVRLQEFDRGEVELRLMESTVRCLDEMDFSFDDVFFDRWLEQLLAGLATPETNDYYGGGRSHRGIDRGLFSRFLEKEFETSDAIPRWFEVAMDFTDDEDGILVVTTPEGREIPIQGWIDRVSTFECDDGTIKGLVHDYKTSDPKTILTIDGVEFQLPLYALAAQAYLSAEYGDALTEVDGQFYVVDPPAKVTLKQSLNDYLGRRGGADPDYDRYLTDTVPSWLAEVVDGIEDGAFQTTTLPPKEAGCHYCDYRYVCDVRHHQRQDVIQSMDAEGSAGYIPQRARTDSFLDTLVGDDA